MPPPPSPPAEVTGSPPTGNNHRRERPSSRNARATGWSGKAVRGNSSGPGGRGAGGRGGGLPAMGGRGQGGVVPWWWHPGRRGAKHECRRGGRSTRGCANGGRHGCRLTRSRASTAGNLQQDNSPDDASGWYTTRHTLDGNVAQRTSDAADPLPPSILLTRPVRDDGGRSCSHTMSGERRASWLENEA